MRRIRFYALILVTLCGVAGVVFFCSGSIQGPAISSGSSSTIPTPTTHNYKDAVAKLEAERLRLASRFQHASTTEQTAVIAEARRILTHAIYDDLFSAWYGTPWDFNGTSETPQQGKIACGYFVSTILRDAGWKVERVRLAQQASENIILSLTTDSFVKRFRRVAIADFVSAVKQWGPGIYIVGLDIHVGFIVNTEGEILSPSDEVYFVHSSYVDPYTVIKEKAIESRILASSNYRVLGKVFADDLFITNWLLGKPISTKTLRE